MRAESLPIKHYALGIFDGPHATPAPADDGPIFLGIKNVTPSGRLDLSVVRHVSEQQFEQWTRRVTPREDDIVFSYEATLHLYARIPPGFVGCLGRRMALVRPDPGKVDSRFLLYYFLSPTWRAKMEAITINGATVNRIPLTAFPDIEVEFPSLARQALIGEALSNYDDLIDNNRKRIALLEDAARLLYREWFVHLRFPGHEHVESLDGVPKGWALADVGDLLKLQRGHDLPSAVRVPGAVPVVSSSGITGFHDQAKAKAPGVVTGRYGTLGEVYYVEVDYWPLNTALYVVDFKGIDPLFTYYLLKFLLRGIDTQKAAVPGLDRNVLHKLRVLRPPAGLIAAFLEVVHDQHRQIRLLMDMNSRLAQARDLLLPRLMRGDLVV